MKIAQRVGPISVAMIGCLISLCFVTAAVGQTAQPPHEAFTQEGLENLADKLVELNKDNKFHGTVLIAQDGKVLFEKAVGYSNFDEKKPLDEIASFRLASVSKQFIAMGIMLLKQDGKLDFDDPIQKFLPSLPYETITIKHLLQHTGGLPDYMRLFNKHWDVGRKKGANRKMAFNKDVVELFSSIQPKPDFQPGEKFSYSNTGYVLLGHIIEKASGQPVAEFIQDRIFKPLEMSRSRVFVDGDSFQLPHRVYGFWFDQTSKKSGQNDWHYLNGMVGDGGLYCSARDLVKWDQALYTNQLVPQTDLQVAFRPGELNDGGKTNYGFGWVVKTSPSGLVVEHTGGWVGFRTFIKRELKDRILTIVLTNNSCRDMNVVFAAIDNARKPTVGSNE